MAQLMESPYFYEQALPYEHCCHVSICAARPSSQAAGANVERARGEVVLPLDLPKSANYRCAHYQCALIMPEPNAMQPATENAAPKKATNLSISRDLLEEARRLNINLSATLEQALVEKVRQEKRRQWLEENREAMEACNELAERNGLFADRHRVF
jgi:antitoxin CcdA